MEKTMSLLPIILFLVFFVLPATVFILLVLKLVKKSKDSSWTGEVIDKVHNEKRDFDNPKKMEHFYYLVVKADQGRQMNVGLSEQMWSGFEKGDGIKKDKGKLYPEKVENI